MTDAYASAYAESLAEPARFWGKAADQIEWVRRPRAVMDTSHPPKVRWFPGGMLNTCYNAVDLHVAVGRGEQAALVYDSPVTGGLRRISYRELRTRSPASPACYAISAWKRATASSSTCRWCPKPSSGCSRQHASVRSTRWCSAASPRRARPAHPARGAEGDPHGLLRRRAEPHRGVQATARPRHRHA